MVDSERMHTFFYDGHCAICLTKIPIPILKPESEIPDEHRSQVLERLAEGEIIYWPTLPESQHLLELVRGVRCPVNSTHVVRFGHAPKLPSVWVLVSAFFAAVFLTYVLMAIEWLGRSPPQNLM